MQAMPKTHTVTATFSVASSHHDRAVRTVEGWLTGSPAARRPDSVLTVRVTPSNLLTVDLPPGWLTVVADLAAAAELFTRRASAGIDPTDTTSIEITAEYQMLERAVATYWRHDRGEIPLDPVDWKDVAATLQEKITLAGDRYGKLEAERDTLEQELKKAKDDRIRPVNYQGSDPILPGLQFQIETLHVQKSLLNAQIEGFKRNAKRDEETALNQAERIKKHHERLEAMAGRNNELWLKLRSADEERAKLKAELAHVRKDYAEEQQRYESCCRDRQYWQERALQDEQLMQAVTDHPTSRVRFNIGPDGAYNGYTWSPRGGKRHGAETDQQSYRGEPGEVGSNLTAGDLVRRLNLTTDPAGTVRVVRTGGTRTATKDAQSVSDQSAGPDGSAGGLKQAARAIDGEQAPGALPNQPGRDQTTPDRYPGPAYPSPED